MADQSNEEASMEYEARDHEPQTLAERVKHKNEKRLMAIEGVEGVGISEDKSGNEVLMIYLRDEAAKSRIPDEIDKIRVQTTVTGKIDAL